MKPKIVEYVNGRAIIKWRVPLSARLYLLLFGEIYACFKDKGPRDTEVRLSMFDPERE